MATLPVNARGRASRSNDSSRFDAFTRGTFDDGWTEEDGEPAQLETTLTAEKARVIISRNDSPDIGFDRSINPYRGCEHGCIYCYARPSHAYMGLSPGLDFETKLFFKPEAAQLLERATQLGLENDRQRDRRSEQHVLQDRREHQQVQQVRDGQHDEDDEQTQDDLHRTRAANQQQHVVRQDRRRDDVDHVGQADRDSPRRPDDHGASPRNSGSA